MIRLQRVGRKNDPSFRVVVVDSRRAAKTGQAIELVGSHDARAKRAELKTERIKYWLSVGAQVSATVNNLLVKQGVIEKHKIDVSSKKLGKKATAAKAARAEAAAKATEASVAPVATPVEKISDEVVETTEVAPTEEPVVA